MDTNDRADLSALAADLDKTTGFDRLSDLFVDSISAVPVAGSIVAAVARQVLPRDSLIYLTLFAVEAARRVEALEEDKLDREYLVSQEFREDLEQVLDAQALLLQRKKRGYFLAAIKNAASTDRPGEAERRRMLDALVKFRPSHLGLLAVVFTAGADVGPGTADQYLSIRLPGVPIEVVKLDWNDLTGEGMLGGYPSGLANTPIAQMVRSKLTPYGQDFVGFIEADAEPESNGS